MAKSSWTKLSTCSEGVVENAAEPSNRGKAVGFFKKEYVTYIFEALQTYLPLFRFEFDYILAALKKPYVAVMDGITSE